jgi:hypothetical protein
MEPAKGMMRAVWGNAELSSMERLMLTFTEGEAEATRAEVSQWSLHPAPRKFRFKSTMRASVAQDHAEIRCIRNEGGPKCDHP